MSQKMANYSAPCWKKPEIAAFLGNGLRYCGENVP